MRATFRLRRSFKKARARLMAESGIPGRAAPTSGRAEAALILSAQKDARCDPEDAEPGPLRPLTMLRLAHRVALRSTHPHHRHASIVLRGGAVIATGYNHDDRHSEVVALSKLWPSKRRGTTVVNLRLTNAGSVAMARPCEECLEFLRESGVESVRWTTGEGIEEARL